MDPRIKKLANLLVNHSLSIRKNDLVGVFAGPEAKDLVNEISKLILLKGAYPIIRSRIEGFSYTYYSYASDEQLKSIPKLSMLEARMLVLPVALPNEALISMKPASWPPSESICDTTGVQW